MKIDISRVYEDRITQIEIDEKQAIIAKKWSELAKLRVEKSKLQAILAQKEGEKQ